MIIESAHRYKAASKHMNRASYTFFHLRLADLHNKWLISEGASRPCSQPPTKKAKKRRGPALATSFSVKDVDAAFGEELTVVG